MEITREVNNILVEAYEVAKKYNIQNHKLEFKDMGYKIEDLYRVKELLDKERERDA